jgi:hypothetical protein
MTHIKFTDTIDLEDERGIYIGPINVYAEIMREEGTMWVEDLAIQTYRDGRELELRRSHQAAQSELWRKIFALVERALMSGAQREHLAERLDEEEALLSEWDGYEYEPPEMEVA